MKRAFTLIELMVVISIIALLASIVLASLSAARTKATTAAGVALDTEMYQGYGASAVAIWDFESYVFGSPPGSAVAIDSANPAPSASSVLVIYTSILGGNAAPESSNVFQGKYALFVTGSSTFLNPSDTYLSTFSPANGSISLWMDMTKASYPAGIFCSQTDNQFCILDSDSSGNFIQVNWTNSVNSLSSLSISLPASSYVGKWTHIAVSWSSTTGNISIYVNGSQAATASYTPSNMASLSSLSFCVGGDFQGHNMYGYLDEIRVYSQSLQTGEIPKIYAEGLPRKYFLADANAGIYGK